MKKLYFLLPIVLWIITGFVWDYSIPFIYGVLPLPFVLWIVVDAFMLGITVISMDFAITKNKD